MSAGELLATVQARGATARAEIGDDGAAVLVVAPRAAIGDLLPDIQRFKPQLLELLARPLAQTRDALDGSHADDGNASGKADDARALELLAKYRRGGALLCLETIARGGAAWLALACDLSDVTPKQRAPAWKQIERNARQLQRALELEAARAASAPPFAGKSGECAPSEANA